MTTSERRELQRLKIRILTAANEEERKRAADQLASAVLRRAKVFVGQAKRPPHETCVLNISA